MKLISGISLDRGKKRTFDKNTDEARTCSSRSVSREARTVLTSLCGVHDCKSCKQRSDVGLASRSVAPLLRFSSASGTTGSDDVTLRLAIFRMNPLLLGRLAENIAHALLHSTALEVSKSCLCLKVTHDPLKHFDLAVRSVFNFQCR